MLHRAILEIAQLDHSVPKTVVSQAVPCIYDEIRRKVASECSNAEAMWSCQSVIHLKSYCVLTQCDVTTTVTAYRYMKFLSNKSTNT